MKRHCNLCGASEWGDMGTRRNVRCLACGSLERTRAVKLILDRLGLPKPGAKMLHIAPERSLAGWLARVCGDGYDPVDLDPSLYLHAGARRFDLVTDSPSLPDDHYDIILHMHVLEHVPCTIAHVLFHLHRALKPDGRHVFCLPLMPGRYDECFAPLGEEETLRRFGQRDHVRRFGIEDIDRHIGLILRLDTDFSLYRTHNREELDACNIPESQRQGLHGSTIFVARKSDYRLR